MKTQQQQQQQPNILRSSSSSAVTSDRLHRTTTSKYAGNLNNMLNRNNNRNINNKNNLSMKTTLVAEVNGNNVEDDKFEIPLPFGYHMDLDFLRMCSGEQLVSGETLDRLKDLRKARRKQRKTLEALMGIRQEQKDRERRVKELSLNVRTRSASTPPKNDFGDKTDGSNLLKILTNQPPPDVVNTPEFIRDALKDAMNDFELCLERSREDEEIKLGRTRAGGLESFDLIHSTPKTPKSQRMSKFNTFPRSLSSPEDEQQPGGRSTYKMFRGNSNSSLSSVSTNSSSLPYGQSATDVLLSGLPSSVANRKEEDVDSIGSIGSEMSAHALRGIREQMAMSLAKLKEYEGQVQAIPVMQVKLSVLKEEKRLLMLKLKQREMQLRREQNGGSLDEDDDPLDYDSEEEDLDERYERSGLVLKKKLEEINNSRARSESPYMRMRSPMFNPNEFISVNRAKGGYSSDSEVMQTLSDKKYLMEEKKTTYTMTKTKSKPKVNLAAEPLRSELQVFTSPKKDVRNTAVNTDPMPEPPERVVIKERSPPPLKRTRDRANNTDPPPRSPPPARKVNHGTNTTKARSMARGTGTTLAMDKILTSDEAEKRIQEAIFKTEEEIMGCPLLQKAMAQVEHEAIHGVKPKADMVESGCQVGDENLRPFVISVALQCKLDETNPVLVEKSCEYCQNREMVDSALQMNASTASLERRSFSLDPAVEKLVRTIGVGDCLIIEEPKEPTKFREMGVCTEKWVEVIKASKQTDTEDFAFKDTESPRVADMVFEPSPERVVMERRNSLRRQSVNPGSPSVSRRSSGVNSPVHSRKTSANVTAAPKVVTKSMGTMTMTEVKPKVRDAKTGDLAPKMKSVGTNAMMMLNLTPSHGLAPGSPLVTPEHEKLPAVNLSLCDKCNKDIKQVAEGIMSGPMSSSCPSPRIQPPSPDMPWLSKIPRPVPENPDVHKLKPATSTGNLSDLSNRSRSPMMQRSKSNMTPTMGRKIMSPIGHNRPMGTPPPHPSTPPVGSRRAPSPLARSQSPNEKRSLIPKLSPATGRKRIPSPLSLSRGSTSGLQSPCSDEVRRSLIPRVQTPPALRRMFPKESDKLAAKDRQVVRKNTVTKLTGGVSNPELEKKTMGSRSGSMSSSMIKRFSDIKERDDFSGSSSDEEDSKKKDPVTATVSKSSISAFPLPGTALFTPIRENRTKVEPSKEMRAALKVLNDSLGRGSSRGNAQVTNAVNIIQQEWFKISSTKQSNPLDVEDYLDAIDDVSKEVLDRVVNLMDVNGNTALHYSVSHGNFDVVSVLLDSKVCNANILNKAGYTCIMLISLAAIANTTHRAVVARLFGMGDVNVRATQHGQTALMLAVSHGRADMVMLLVEAGADVNIRDEDGSTALMCAAEHGHMEIVKFLLQQAETNVLAKDNDGLTALAVAMEAGHRDVGVMLYANMSFSRGTSPYSSMRMKKSSAGSLGGSRSQTPVMAQSMKTPPPMGPTPPLRTRRNSSNQ